MTQPAVQRREPAPPVSAPRSAYSWYVAGAASWFGAGGMQGVIFSWLVAMELRAPADWVGIAQSATMIPAFLLILVGGAVADRHDRRALLIRYHLVGAALAAVLLAVVASGMLSLAFLIAFAVSVGTLGAFTMPARDSLLSEVTGGREMMRAVTGLTVLTFAASGTGAALAGGASFVGIVPIIAVYGVLFMLGVPTLLRLAPAPPHGETHLHLRELVRGTQEVFATPALRGVFLLISSVGLLFVGPFMVVFPLLVRDFYGGDVGQLGLLGMTFPIGTMLGSLALLWWGEIRRKGLAQVLALLSGAGCLGAIGLGLPFEGTLVAVSLFGVGAAVVMNTGRTVFQERASPENRARVLASFQLGIMGTAGLFGAPLSGVLVDQIGPLATCITMASAMAVVLAGVSVATDVLRVE